MRTAGRLATPASDRVRPSRARVPSFSAGLRLRAVTGEREMPGTPTLDIGSPPEALPAHLGCGLRKVVAIQIAPGRSSRDTEHLSDLRRSEQVEHEREGSGWHGQCHEA